MAEIQIQSTAGKIIAVVIIIAVAIFAGNKRGRTLETEAADKILEYIGVSEELRGSLDAIKEAGGVDAENAEELIAEMLEDARAKMEIASITARGSIEDPVVRVEILIDGEPPTETEPIQYYRMSYSVITGWKVEHESSKISYYLAFF